MCNKKRSIEWEKVAQEANGKRRLKLNKLDEMKEKRRLGKRMERKNITKGDQKYEKIR
jgi:hypothetical protein